MTLGDLSLIARRYSLIEALGAGGMGTVYRATDRLTGREIALKRVTTEIDSHHVSDTTFGQEFRLALAREFKVASSLRHPNIVQMLDYGFDEQREPFFTMELLQQPKTFTDACRELALEERLDYFVQMLQALTYLHRRGIIHHDLKPANVLVVEHEVKLLDFGLALVHSGLQPAETGVTAGTLAYMAPEILMGEPASISSDLYAVGMMGYEVFAGEHPFAINQPARLIQQIINTIPDVNAIDVPMELGMVFWRLLAKDPAERFASAPDVIRGINRASIHPYPVESSATRESFLQASRLVARDEELAYLTRLLHEAMTGKGSVQLIGGESGVGKSRLIEEIRSLAMVNGAVVMRGQATDVGSRPFEIWLPVIRSLCLTANDLTNQQIAMLKVLVVELDRLLGRELDAIEPLEVRPEQLLEEILGFFVTVIRHVKSPVVILLDDLQWAGSESLKLLAQLQTVAADLPLLIVGSYRDNERLSMADEVPNAPIMKLRRLDAKGIEQLSAAMLGSAGRREQVVELLRRESEGNIFFIIEVVRVLAKEVDRLENIGMATLPPSVFAGSIKTVMQRRLDNLDDQQRYLVQVAAVMGRQLDLPILRRVAPEADFETWLTACSNAAVLEADEDTWRFSHDKLREAIVETMVAAERQTLHSRVANAMEHFFAASPEYATALAHHWGAAGDRAREERYIYLSAQQALRTGGYHEAQRAFQRVEELLPLLNLDEERLIVRLANLRDFMGQTMLARGYYDRAGSYFHDMHQLADTLNDVPLQARALKMLGLTAMAMSDFEQAFERYSQALTLFRELQDSASIPELLNHLGDVHYEVDDQETAKHYYQESMTISRQAGSGFTMAGAVRTRTTQTVANVSDSEHHRSYALLVRVLGVAQQQNDVRGISETLMSLARLALAQGDKLIAFEIVAFLAQWSQTPDTLVDEVEEMVFDLQEALPDVQASEVWERAKKTDLEGLINTLL